MDFSYEYSHEQQDFRAEVVAWLDENAPDHADALIDSGDSAAGCDTLNALSRSLGDRGWLSPTASLSEGGAGLSADLAVVLLEELNSRGLLTLLTGEAQALRAAILGWSATEEQHHSALAESLSKGERSVWRHRIAISPTAANRAGMLDPDSVGIYASPDADGYILNGSGMFDGIGDRPDILWTVALLESNDDSNAPIIPVCLIVDASLEGVTVVRARSLAASAPRRVDFSNVWVLRAERLGAEGEGHSVIRAAVSLDPRANIPSWVESETDALIEYARTTESAGRPLSADPIRARILVEAYIASRISRLLRIRAAWLERTGYTMESATAGALESIRRREAASSLSDAARQVAGPRALLSAEDPASADGGRFDRLARRDLADRADGGDHDRETLAAELGLNALGPDTES